MFSVDLNLHDFGPQIEAIIKGFLPMWLFVKCLVFDDELGLADTSHELCLRAWQEANVLTGDVHLAVELLVITVHDALDKEHTSVTADEDLVLVLQDLCELHGGVAPHWSYKSVGTEVPYLDTAVDWPADQPVAMMQAGHKVKGRDDCVVTIQSFVLFFLPHLWGPLPYLYRSFLCGSVEVFVVTRGLQTCECLQTCRLVWQDTFLLFTSAR